MLAPIALFVYNRPTHTRQTVEALKNNALAAQSDLVIFSDAPKTEEKAQSVRAVRDYIHTIQGFNSVSIIERDRNYGLANSIISGVSSLVEKYGRVIVLEDDLIVTSGFLDFMNQALDHYEHQPEVIQVSGYMFPVDLDIAEDSLFLPLTTSWGWATWKRAWDLFDPDAKGYERVKNDSALRRRFNLDGAYDYFSMLEDQLAGRVDSWAIRWQLSTFLVGGLTLYPKHSLVTNTGFDGSGTHGAASGLLSKSGARDGFQPLRNYPDNVQVSPSWNVVRKRLKSRVSFFRKVKHIVHIRIQRHLSKQ